MRLIGITGLARSGKDTLAGYLVNTHAFHLYKMAFPLKRLIAARFGLTFDEVDSGDWRDKPDHQFGHKSNECGNYFTLRSWMQWMGTDVARNTFGEDCWIPLMLKEWEAVKNPFKHPEDFEPRGMVVSDIRFDNEATAIIKAGGIVVRVVRPGVQAVEAHVSEKGVSPHLIEVDILNDRDINTFLKRAEAILDV